jgi:PmbA protein
MSSLLDQSTLTDLADRLVAAARRAGADAADALAVRSVSLAVEVREGAVEESERSEGDDVGLRVFVGSRQAVVSTNDVKADVAQLAERAVAMARAAPEDPFAGLADPAQLARDIPDLELLDPDLPTVAQLEERAQRAESAGLAVKGVTKSGGASASAGIGGMVLVTSHGFRGAYLNSGQSVSMTAISGEGTAMERDYDYSSAIHGTDLEPPEKVGRTAGERTKSMLALFYALAVALIALAGWSAGGGVVFVLGLGAFAAHLAWQVARLDIHDPALCLAVFKSNRDAGLILFAGLALDAALVNSQ